MTRLTPTVALALGLVLFLSCKHEPPTVHVWASAMAAKALEPFAAEFERVHGKRLEIEKVGWGDVQKKTLLSLAARSGVPDLVVADPIWMGGMISAGGLMPLEGMLKDGELDAFVPSSLDTYRWEKRLYGLPLDVDLLVILYRADLFDPHLTGEAKEFPATWDEFAAASERMMAAAEPGARRKAMLMDPSDNGAFYMGYGPTFGVEWFNTDYTQSQLDSPAASRMVSFLKRICAPDGAAKRWNAKTDGDPTPLYRSGEVASIQAGPWYMGKMEKEAPEMAGKWRVAPLPVAQAGLPTGGLGGSGLAIPVLAKDPEGGMAAMRLMTSPAFQRAYFDLVGSPPPLKEAWDWPALNRPMDYFGGQNCFQVVRTAIESAGPMPLSPSPMALDAPLQEALQAVLVNGADIEGALKVAKNKADEALGLEK